MFSYFQTNIKTNKHTSPTNIKSVYNTKITVTPSIKYCQINKYEPTLEQAILKHHLVI